MINNNESLLLELESFFSALSDRTRLEIVFYLLEKGKATVQDMSRDLKKSQSLISHHLSCLRNCGVVKVEKNGKYSEYSINGEDVKEIIFIATRHAKNYGKSILSCDIIKEEKENR